MKRALASVCLLSVLGCTAVNEEADGGVLDPGLHPDRPAHFVADVVPILQRHCLTCHDAEKASGGLVLEPGKAFEGLVNAASACDPAVKRVAPPSLEASLLWRKLSDAPSKCGSAMPEKTAGLKSVAPADFETIERWIRQGAPNN